MLAHFHRLADPWRHPWDAFLGVLAPIGGVRDKLRIARLRRRVLTTELSAMFASRDVSAMEFLREFGFSPEVIQRFFRPFFSGVFLESELQTSSRMLPFVFRMFASGDAALTARAWRQSLAVGDAIPGIESACRQKSHASTTAICGQASDCVSGESRPTAVLRDCTTVEGLRSLGMPEA